METKFNVGDRVFLTKPKYKRGDTLEWIPDMEVYIGKVLIVKSIYLDDYTCLCEFENMRIWLCVSWLTKAEEQPTEQVAEQVTEQVAERIDWEQRKWDLASKIYAEMENVTLESSVRQAEIFIKYYKQTINICRTGCNERFYSNPHRSKTNNGDERR